MNTILLTAILSFLVPLTCFVFCFITMVMNDHLESLFVVSPVQFSIFSISFLFCSISILCSRKPHRRSATASLRGFLCVAFQTVPVLVWLVMTLSSVGLTGDGPFKCWSDWWWPFQVLVWLVMALSSVGLTGDGPFKCWCDWWWPFEVSVWLVMALSNVGVTGDGPFKCWCDWWWPFQVSVWLVMALSSVSVTGDGPSSVGLIIDGPFKCWSDW